MSDFIVSVIIPVFNAEKFLADAVLSALNIAEVGEVILIEDGSTDASLAICHKLATIYSKVHLYQHPQGVNQGAGNSRNLGIFKSTLPYIAFLDADDYYLPNRFDEEKSIFHHKPFVDGVYSATGIHFENDHAKKKWDNFKSSERITTLNDRLEGEELFRGLLWGGCGRFTTDAITVRKSLFEKTGYFNSSTIAEDSNMWLKMSLAGYLVAGEIVDPVAVRRVHDDNRSVISQDVQSGYWKLNYSDLFYWAITKEFVSFDQKNMIFISCRNSMGYSTDFSFLHLYIIFDKPSVLLSTFYWRKIFQILKHFSFE